MRGPVNPWNSVLDQRRTALKTAYRNPIFPGCDLAAETATASQKRASLRSIPIIAGAAGDYQIISTLVGRKLIYEVVLWNVTAQNLSLYQGASAGGILLLDLPSFPGPAMMTLGFNGNFEMPHFEIDAGQPFVLNLQNATQVTGFIRYRISTGSF